MADLCGIVVRSRGLRRHYAFLFTRHRTVRLEKELEGRTLLAEVPFEFEWHQPLQIEVLAKGSVLTLLVDGAVVLSITDDEPRLAS
ncbi:hypothetical protein ABTM94_19025, partial [Acinetobacter baumannii]